MFGLWRYLLALLVMQSHLWPEAAPWSGFYAVFAFYLLSGYLMAMVLSTSYSSDFAGRYRFLLNRALRIYPLYYAALFMAIILAMEIPDVAGRLVPVFRFPFDLDTWVHQFTLFGLTWDRSRLVPQAWSLEVELLFYVLMAAGLIRSRRMTGLWLTLSLAYTAVLVIRADSFADRYYPPAAASLPFSAGAALWFYGASFLGRIPRWFAPVAVALFLGHSFLAGRIWDDPTFYGLYLSTFLAGTAVLGLASAGRGPHKPFLRSADLFLGSLSYPLFLCHWSVAVMLASVGASEKLGAGLFLAAIPTGSTVALAFHLLVQRRIDTLRVRVRSGKSRSSFK